jgi:hypothetical protein
MTDQQEIISNGTPHEVHLPEGSKTAVHKTATPTDPQIRNTQVNPDEEVEVEVVEVVKSVSHSQEDDNRPTRMTPAAAAGHEADRFLNVETAERPDHRVNDGGGPETPDHAPAHALPLTLVMSDLPSLDLPATEETFAATVGFAASAPQAPGAPTPAAQELAAQADTGVASGEVIAQADAQAVQPEAVARVDAKAAPAEVLAPAQLMEEMSFPARVVKLKMANDQVRGQIEKLEKPLFPPLPVETPAAPKGKGKEPAAKPAKGH